MRMRPLMLPLLVALCLATAGCGDGTSAPGAGSRADADADRGDVPAGGGPADGAYVATEVTGRSLVEGTRIRLSWTGDRLSAHAGCNQMSGTGSVTDGRLVVTGLGMTEMGCEPGRTEQDQWVADLLTSGPEIGTGADGFTLTGDTVAVRFTTEVLPADASLEGTTWLLESVVEGDVASSAVGGTEDSAPRFRIDDGRVEGFDGCNDLSGLVEVSEDRISSDDDLVATQRQCVMAVPPLDILLAGSSYVVEGKRLTLTRGEVSLVFRAS